MTDEPDELLHGLHRRAHAYAAEVVREIAAHRYHGVERETLVILEAIEADIARAFVVGFLRGRGNGARQGAEVRADNGAAVQATPVASQGAKVTVHLWMQGEPRRTTACGKSVDHRRVTFVRESVTCVACLASMARPVRMPADNG